MCRPPGIAMLFTYLNYSDTIGNKSNDNAPKARRVQISKRKENLMKYKLLACALCLGECLILSNQSQAAPGSVYRDAETRNNSTYTQYNNAQQKSSYSYQAHEFKNNASNDGTGDIRFVMEYQIDLFTSTKSVLSLSDDYGKLSSKGKGTFMNMNGMLLLGVTFSDLNAQVGLTASRQEENNIENTNFGVEMRIPLTRGTLQPYFAASVFYSTIDMAAIEDSVSAIGFGLEGGLLYNLTRNTYIKGGISYGYTNFEEEDSGIKATLTNTSWSFNTGLGYRF